MTTRRVQLAALVAGVLLLYGAGLTYSPPYLHEAEVLFGLHAHAIATTGHDVYGRFLPLYFQMKPIGDNVWFHPAIVYVDGAVPAGAAVCRVGDPAAVDPRRPR